MSQGDVAKRRAALVSELRSLKYAVRYEGGPIERAADELAAAERERIALQDKVGRVQALPRETLSEVTLGGHMVITAVEAVRADALNAALAPRAEATPDNAATPDMLQKEKDDV